jgi:hypothetical protein
MRPAVGLPALVSAVDCRGIVIEAKTKRHPAALGNGIAGDSARVTLPPEELGAARQLHVAGETVIAHVTGQEHFEPGEPMRLTIDPADVQLFDAGTGKRLAERPDATAARPRQRRAFASA